MQIQLEDLLKKRYIHSSVSPYGAPPLFVRKKDNTMRLCVDYRQPNKGTIKNIYPLQRIDYLFDKLKISNINLRYGNHQLGIKDEDISKTTLKTWYGHYEYIILPFRLKISLSTFMCLNNGVFNEYLGKFIILFLDDIMVYSKSEKEHEEHI